MEQSSEAVRTTTYSHKHCCSRRRWYEDGLWGRAGGGVQSNGRRCPPLPCRRSVNLLHLAGALGAGLQLCDALGALDARRAGLVISAALAAAAMEGHVWFQRLGD